MSALITQARHRVPRIAEAAVERARLTVVPRASRRRAARVPFVTLVVLVLVGGVAGLLCFNTSMQQASFTATSLEDRATALDAQEQGLQMQLAALRDPQRVAEAAQKQGMVPVSAPAFLRLSDGRVIGKPVPASSADSVRITPLPARKPASLQPKPVIETAPAPEPSSTKPMRSTKPSSDGAATRSRGAGDGTKKQHGPSRAQQQTQNQAQNQQEQGSQR